MLIFKVERLESRQGSYLIKKVKHNRQRHVIVRKVQRFKRRAATHKVQSVLRIGCIAKLIVRQVEVFKLGRVLAQVRD